MSWLDQNDVKCATLGQAKAKLSVSLDSPDVNKADCASPRPHCQNAAFLSPVAEHEAAEYIMQIIGLETNTSGPCPPEEEANECGEIGIFIPPPSPSVEKHLSSSLPLRATTALLLLSLLSPPSVPAPSSLSPFFLASSSTAARR